MKLKHEMMAVIAAGALAFTASFAGAQQGSTTPGTQDTRDSRQDPRLIQQIQQALNNKGFRVDEVNGRMGPSTQSALAQFQQSQGLPATGAPDDQTLAALGVQAQMGMGGAGSGALGGPMPRGPADPCAPGMGSPGSNTGGSRDLSGSDPAGVGRGGLGSPGPETGRGGIPPR